jgi:hypothetical protein
MLCAQGFHIPGDACSALPGSTGGKGRLLFLNNVAHSNLVGLVLRGVPDGGACTALANFTTYLNWDFDIITLKGITTDVNLQHIVVAGVLIWSATTAHASLQCTFLQGAVVRYQQYITFMISVHHSDLPSICLLCFSTCA